MSLNAVIGVAKRMVKVYVRHVGRLQKQHQLNMGCVKMSENKKYSKMTLEERKEVLERMMKDAECVEVLFWGLRLSRTHDAPVQKVTVYFKE